MSYSLKGGKFNNFFEVPNDIVDKHIRLASGDQLKLLLLILRNPGKYSNAMEIAKALRIDKEDVEDALQYWINSDVIVPSESVHVKEETNVPEKFVPAKGSQATEKPSVIEYSKPSSLEIATRISESSEIANMFKDLQAKLGKTIGYDGQCTFMMLHDYYGLPADVIYMITDYCVSIGKSGYSYIQKVGESWSEQEILTIDKAAEKIQSLSGVESFWKKFCVSTGIKNPKPTSKQTEYVENWLKQLKMPYDMIVAAYEETVEKTGKPSFSYMNSILVRWNNEGFKSLDDVNTESKNRQKATEVKNSGNASYDLESFRKKSIGDKLKYERKK